MHICGAFSGRSLHASPRHRRTIAAGESDARLDDNFVVGGVIWFGVTFSEAVAVTGEILGVAEPCRRRVRSFERLDVADMEPGPYGAPDGAGLLRNSGS